MSENVTTIGLGEKVSGYAGGWNPKRNCKLWLGKYSGRRSSQDWHSKNTLGLSVSSTVPLILESDTLSIGYENTYKDGSEAVPGNAKGLFDKASDFLEQITYLAGTTGIRGASQWEMVKRASKFDAPKVWEKTSPLKVEGDITFSFKFGCGGLFNAYEEVVKPIIVIASLFAPRELAAGENTWIEPPLPTMGEWGARFLSSAIGSVITSGKEMSSKFKDQFSEKELPSEERQRQKAAAEQGTDAVFNEKIGSIMDERTKQENEELKATDMSWMDNAINATGKVSSGLVNASISLRNEIFDAIHSGAAAILEEGGYATSGSWGANKFAIAYMKIGNFYLGPLTVSSVNISFDNKMLDENGYPSSGTVTLGGLSSYVTATDKELFRML